jgi:hypothetical protein
MDEILKQLKGVASDAIPEKQKQLLSTNKTPMAIADEIQKLDRISYENMGPS